MFRPMTGSSRLTLEKTTTTAILQIKGLQVAYHKIVAVSDVNLEVRHQGFAFLIGANGAGKTTILKTITGLLKPVSGAVVFRGKNITGHHPAAIATIGISMVPEKRGIFYDLSVKDNLKLGAFHKWEKSYINRRMELMIDLFPILGARQYQPGGTLSGGEQQMLAIARAIMSEPQLLLLDEPSMGLAPMIVRQVFSKISEISSAGATILLVEQNAKMALNYAKEGYVVENGRIILHGKSRELINHEKVRKAYLGG
jgi:branched-chain amino acid transport system ATP-binding protein